MMYDFNADDIFEMAQQMERNGATFYQSAAAAVDNAEAKDLLLKLAEMEVKHEETFSHMRSQLGKSEKTSTVFDPEEESVRYLRALADMRVFFKKELDTSSLEAILKDAITAEKDSIVFYLGMRDAVPQNMGRGRLDNIIKEEMEHIRILGTALGAAGK